VHNAVDVVGVKCKEGKETPSNAFSERTTRAFILKYIPYVTAYGRSGYFRVALGFGALPTPCRVINDCSSLNKFTKIPAHLFKIIDVLISDLDAGVPITTLVFMYHA
jgi:hypothetical protein